ncbi:MAG TPA: filamentous hemagglutinin N-terminal domain-containing protein, partial [Coleofasciculaceae cyanobacterium]
MKARSIFHIILASCCLIAVYQPVSAQITPDDTLSTERSRVIPQNSSTERIEGGARRGANLFHSFQEFNVDQGRGAYFANPAGVENILSRVTGGNPSEILGTLGVLEGNANLFFLNPNGIIFGSNTKLDVRGSFLGSTSDSFIFDNGFVFSAANPQSPPLLTISVPVGLQFGRNPGAIRFLGTSGFQSSRHGLGLTVPPGRTVALVGGEMTLQGAFLGAPGGRIEIGSVAPLSQIRLHSADGGWRLGYEGSQGFQNIEVSRSLIDTSVRANNNFQLLSSDGDISIRASNLDIGGTSIVRASTFTALPGGDITIDVENLTLREGTNVVSVAFDRGKAGNLTVNASESITLTGAIDIGSFISPTL